MIDGILEDREKRYDRVIELINIYKRPVICGKINYPGEDKNTVYAYKAFEILKSEMDKHFQHVMHREITCGFDGSALLMINDIDALDIKKTAILIEENVNIGRVFDIDIYNLEGQPIERGQIGFPKRNCIICGDNPRVCMKEKRHNFEQVISRVNEIICLNT